MERPERSGFTTLDFLTWAEISSLELSPKFQRRAVWKTPARSYFIDSLLQDIPVPPIFLRLAQSEDKKRTVREVIDGQQRLRAVLDYVADEYALSRSVVKNEGGKRFSQLPEALKDKIKTYTFSCEVFKNISDADVLEIFSRVNTYSVKLNAQELRNGTYFGLFKRSAYSLAHEHLEFWRRHKIFSEGNIARMLEVELTSELMVAQLAGQQDKKKSLDSYYANYNEHFEEQEKVEDQFRATIDAINETFAGTLVDTEFNRPPLFYTLFAATCHRIFGLPNINLDTPAKGKLVKSEARSLRDAILSLSDKISAAKQDEKVAPRDTPFVNACLRQTDNLRPRDIRLRRLYKDAFQA